MIVTWKAVFYIWLAALPFMGGAAALTYQRYPAPFRQAASWSLKEAHVAQAAYKGYQAKKAKDAADAAKKADEDAASPPF